MRCGEHRRERGDDEHEPERHRERRREQGLQRPVERASASHEHDRRRDRHDAEIEIQLCDVVEHVPKHLAQLVVGLADDAVRAEEIREGPPAHELGDEHERAAADDDAVEPAIGPERHPQPFPAEQRRGAAEP